MTITVQNLLNYLNQLPPDMEVYLDGSEWGEHEYPDLTADEIVENHWLFRVFGGAPGIPRQLTISI